MTDLGSRVSLGFEQVRPHRQHLPATPPSYCQGQGEGQGRVRCEDWRQHRERLHLRRPSQLGRLQRIVRPRYAIGTLSKALRHAATGSPSGQALPREGEQESYQDKKRAIGERNEVEATFGTSKRVYWANDIRAKLDDTADTWIGACFFAKNVMKFLRGLLCLIFAKLGLKAFKRRIAYSIDYLMGVLDPTRGCLVKII